MRNSTGSPSRESARRSAQRKERSGTKMSRNRLDNGSILLIKVVTAKLAPEKYGSGTRTTRSELLENYNLEMHQFVY